MAYGSSQANGQIRAIDTGLHHSHSNAWSQPRPQPTLQLMATPDPWPTEWGQGSSLHPHGHWSDSIPLHHNGDSGLFLNDESYILGGKHILKKKNCIFFSKIFLCSPWSWVVRHWLVSLERFFYHILALKMLFVSAKNSVDHRSIFFLMILR